MKCRKPCFTFRPLVENLESRLQPGSIITGQGYGWSLLADHLSILDDSALAFQGLVPPASSESSTPTPVSTPVDVHSDNQDTAVTRVAANRSEPFSLPTNTLVIKVAADLTNDDLSSPPQTRRAHVLPPAAVATPALPQPVPVIAASSVPHSPLGVASPAPAAPSPVVSTPALASPTKPLDPAGSGPHALSLQISLDTPSVQAFSVNQTTNDLHALPLTLTNTSVQTAYGTTNQATINFLSYLGGSGPDSMNRVVVRNEGGSNFIYVAGTFTNPAGRTDAFAAKLTDGATGVVWATGLTTSSAGPDRASGLAVNGDNVYLAGSLADPTATVQTDGFVTQLDANKGTIGPNVIVPNASLAAVTTDAAGNVYAAGTIGDPDDATRHDAAFLKATADLSTMIYSDFFRFELPPHDGTMAANSAVSTGGGLIVDNRGTAYFAGSVGVLGDPNNDTQILYGRLNAAGTAVNYWFTAGNVTPGPGGRGTAVAFDPSSLDSSGNPTKVVFTGSVNDNGTTISDKSVPTLLNQDLVIGRVHFATFRPMVEDDNGWYVDDRSPDYPQPRVGDWTGNDLVVLADGSSIVTGAAYDPAAPNNPPLSMPSNGIDVHMTHFNATDDSTVMAQQHYVGDPENIFGGSGVDIGYAVALDPTNPMKVYVVGSTTSSDLPTTSGVVQPTYAGGNTTGFVGQASVA